MDCLSSRPCARAAFIAIAFALSACHSTTKDPTTRGFVEPNAIRAQAIAALGALDDPRSDQLLVTLATTMELNAPPDILVQISALNEVARRKDRIAEQVGMRTELLTKLRPVLSRISAVALELPASQQADYLRLSRYLENELLTVRVAAATLNELARGGLNDADEASAAISQHNEVMSASMDPGASTAGLAAAMAPLKLLALTEIEAVSTAARRSAFEIAPTLLIDWLLERLAESRAGRAALTRELMNACDRVNALTVGGGFRRDGDLCRFSRGCIIVPEAHFSASEWWPTRLAEVQIALANSMYGEKLEDLKARQQYLLEVRPDLLLSFIEAQVKSGVMEKAGLGRWCLGELRALLLRAREPNASIRFDQEVDRCLRALLALVRHRNAEIRDESAAVLVANGPEWSAALVEVLQERMKSPVDSDDEAGLANTVSRVLAAVASGRRLDASESSALRVAVLLDAGVGSDAALELLLRDATRATAEWLVDDGAPSQPDRMSESMMHRIGDSLTSGRLTPDPELKARAAAVFYRQFQLHTGEARVHALRYLLELDGAALLSEEAHESISGDPILAAIRTTFIRSYEGGDL